MNILQINGSARREGANSTRVADSIVSRLRSGNPTATLVKRDLASDPHPALDESTLGALFTPVEQRTPEQAAVVARNDALIAEIQAADVIVLGCTHYHWIKEDIMNATHGKAEVIDPSDAIANRVRQLLAT